MKTRMYILMLASMLVGCSLNPKQMGALDGAVCAKIYGTTTVMIAGASKGKGIMVNGQDCSMVSRGAQ